MEHRDCRELARNCLGNSSRLANSFCYCGAKSTESKDYFVFLVFVHGNPEVLPSALALLALSFLLA